LSAFGDLIPIHLVLVDVAPQCFAKPCLNVPKIPLVFAVGPSSNYENPRGLATASRSAHHGSSLCARMAKDFLLLAVNFSLCDISASAKTVVGLITRGHHAGGRCR